MLHQLVGGSAPADCPLRHAVPHKVRVLAQLGQVAYQLGYAYFGGQHSVRPVGIAPGEQLRVFPGAVLYGLPCEGQIFFPGQRRAQPRSTVSRTPQRRATSAMRLELLRSRFCATSMRFLMSRFMNVSPA